MADPEEDPRVPWIHPFGLNLAYARKQFQAAYQTVYALLYTEFIKSLVIPRYIVAICLTII